MTGLDVTVHCAGMITYNFKGKLMFYKDLQEPSEKKKLLRKPRRTMYQTDTEYQQVVQDWERSQVPVDIIPKGNAMSQEFYTREILP